MCFRTSIKNTFLIFALILFSMFLAGKVGAVEVQGELNFYVDPDYDTDARQRIEATLVKTSPSIYFYVGKKWWDGKSQVQKDEVLSNLNNLSNEFDSNIYPTITSVFGREWRPGIDGDNKIAVLFHSIRENATGYFRSADEYSKLQVPNSNEREMIYLSLDHINSSRLKEFLAHEFTHLVVFNQKERIQGVAEEVWLNEARAEYAITILGYNNVYIGSNLQKRIGDFLQRTDDSLTEWQNTKYDYAVVSLFTHYLVDHYGPGILSNSLKLKSVGIESLDQTLLQAGAKESFEDVFTNWTVAITVNNCSINIKYCYFNNRLNDLRINPTLLFLPVYGNSSLSSTNFTKNWSANLHKIVGGNGNLKLEFSSNEGAGFKVPYIIIDKNDNYTVKFLKINENKIGEVNIENFSSQYNALIIIPSLQNKKSGFNGIETLHAYRMEISNLQAPQDDYALIRQLLARIDYLKKQIALLQKGESLNNSCFSLSSDLYFGMYNNDQVKCLQQFLKNQGQGIYPEGLITGNFVNLTKAAVIRFQERYRDEILSPLGLSEGTGFVGSATRKKINQLLQT